MNYDIIYNDIINTSKQRIYKNDYTEKHHIIPRCLGGLNNKENVVQLTYREHFICHWLLCKIYPSNHKIKAAFAKMLGGKNRITSGWMFDVVKRNLKDTHFDWLKNKKPWNKGKKGLQIAWNKGMKMNSQSEESNKKRSETLKQRYKHIEHHRKGQPSWCVGTKGIVKAWNKNIPAPKFECKYCGRYIAGKTNYLRWHNVNCKEYKEADRLLRTKIA